MDEEDSLVVLISADFVPLLNVVDDDMGYGYEHGGVVRISQPADSDISECDLQQACRSPASNRAKENSKVEADPVQWTAGNIYGFHPDGHKNLHHVFFRGGDLIERLS